MGTVGARVRDVAPGVDGSGSGWAVCALKQAHCAQVVTWPSGWAPYAHVAAASPEVTGCHGERLVLLGGAWAEMMRMATDGLA